MFTILSDNVRVLYTDTIADKNPVVFIFKINFLTLKLTY